jgi:pimeloyl-ACP methyl ester carboxylesterase
MPLLDGITARRVPTSRLTVNVLERAGESGTGAPIVLVHGNVSSAAFWQELMLALPADHPVYAVDLRGFGDTETKPVDATRGLRDFSDDLAATLDELGLGAVHLVGWSMGGGVVMTYALDHPVLSLTLQAPVSPYGFGGTRLDGSRLTDDDAGVGGGGANPAFVQSITDQDAGADNPMASRAVFRSAYVAAGYTTEHEDLWVASMLTTATGDGNYPGTAVASENWPGFAAGDSGVLNTMAPKHYNVSGIVDLAVKPPILWVRGDSDAIVADETYFDLNMLGKAGIVPGWPGDEVAPPQPMISQTRAVLDTYAANGGRYTEVVFEACGHSPHLEQPENFVAALLDHVRSV